MQANAYKEVLEVLNNLDKEDYNRIPKEYIEVLEENCNNKHEFKYDTTKSFEEQELLEDTKYILFGLFEKFWATDTQKAKIKAYKVNYINNLEEQKRAKYNPDDIFKKKVINDISSNNDTPSQNALIKIEESNVFKKIINKIKRFLHVS